MPLSDKEKSSLNKKKISSSRFLSSLAEDDENSATHLKKLHFLFSQIEIEFDKLYQENLNLQERLDAVLSKENYAERGDNLESDKVLSAKKSLTGSVKAGSYKIRAQTSRIVSSFKAQSVVSSLVRDFTGHKDGVWQVTSKQNQPIIGTASADHTACIWSVETGRCLLQYQGHHSGSVNSMKFHNSKDLVLTASGDGTAHIWQGAVNWDMVGKKGHSSEEELDEDEDPVEDLKAEVLRTPLIEFGGIGGHSGVVVAADFISPNYDQIITASWDRQAILWDIETHQPLQTLSGKFLDI